MNLGSSWKDSMTRGEAAAAQPGRAARHSRVRARAEPVGGLGVLRKQGQYDEPPWHRLSLKSLERGLDAGLTVSHPQLDPVAVSELPRDRRLSIRDCGREAVNPQASQIFS